MINGSLIKVESIAECNAPLKAILLTCIKRYSVLKNNFWSFSEWLFCTGFTIMLFGHKVQIDHY